MTLLITGKIRQHLQKQFNAIFKEFYVQALSSSDGILSELGVMTLNEFYLSDIPLKFNISEKGVIAKIKLINSKNPGLFMIIKIEDYKPFVKFTF